MPENLFEYAVIRIVPRVEREEFINTGIIIYCPKKKFLQTCFTLNEKRLNSLCNNLDINEIRLHLEAFKRISEGAKSGGSIAALDTASRFRWLTATRSTIIQTSKVHPGLCTNPEDELKKLYNQLVDC